ncbi:polysaccharide biosynthesis protein [SAR86 cluster bacterium]|nr:polysaccharide biosynthesis protein [SAR86 cluster bacterium]
MDILKIINRKKGIFDEDIHLKEEELKKVINRSSFLVIGAAGSIGMSVTKEIFSRDPKLLHAIDISENNLVELVRELRSSKGYISGEFSTFCIDICSDIFENFLKNNSYDFILNLSALKHVRSERDIFTLLRMIDVNVISTAKIISLLEKKNSKYFSVSTDKATNPVNLMGASKLSMENILLKSDNFIFSSARFANVAFSDGSLLSGFINRINKRQPISAPCDISRYFITAKEAGQLCLLSAIFGEKGEVFFPNNDAEIKLTSFSEIALNFLHEIGKVPYECKSEDEARSFLKTDKSEKQWPCYFFESDTTGEKEFEEFYSENENTDFNKYKNVGVIKLDDKKEFELENFLKAINLIRVDKSAKTNDLIKLFSNFLPEFKHKDLGKSLDSKM